MSSKRLGPEAPIPYGMELTLFHLMGMHPDEPVITWDGEIVSVEVFRDMLKARYRQLTERK